MLSGNFSSGMQNLFASQNENQSLFGSVTSESNGHMNADLGAALKHLCPPTNWLNQAALSSTSEDRSRTNLIINYLPQSYEQSDLQRLFERIGPIRQCKLIRDKSTGASLCYGFVDYISPQHAALAITTYHGYETEAKRLRVAYASSGGRRYVPGQRTPSIELNGSSGDSSDNIIGWELLASCLPVDVTEFDVTRLFTHFGNVLSVKFVCPGDAQKLSHASALSDVNCNITDGIFSSRAQSKGTIASVIFEERLSVEAAVARLHGLQLPEASAPLCVRVAGPVTREACARLLLCNRENTEGGPSSRHTSSSQISFSDKFSLGFPSSVASHKIQSFRGLDNIEANENAIPLMSTNSALLQPRPIIRNKGMGLPIVSDNVEYNDFLDVGLRSQSRVAFDRFGHQENHCFEKTSLAVIPKTEASVWTSCTSMITADTLRPGRPQELVSGRKLAITTPLITSSQLCFALTQTGGRGTVFLKLENLQPTGSVCLRGMEHICRKMFAGGAQHIVCPSTGNAGVAAAFACQTLNMACTIVSPDDKDGFTKKRLAIEAPSAKLITHGTSMAEAVNRAEQMVAESNVQFQHHLSNTNAIDMPVRVIHPYETLDVWCGYEAIVEELPPSQPDVIVLPVGGGALLTGVIQGLWNRGWSTTHIVTTETEGADCFARSHNAGHPAVIPKCTSVAKSLGAPSISSKAWNITQYHSLTALTCSDADAVNATRRFLDDHGFLVEPACAVALSAIYNGDIARLQEEGVIRRPANICIIVTGGRNINRKTLGDLEKAVPMNQSSFTANGISANTAQISLAGSTKNPMFGLRQLNQIFGTDLLLGEDDCIGDHTSDMQTSSPDMNQIFTTNNEGSGDLADDSPSPSVSMRS